MAVMAFDTPPRARSKLLRYGLAASGSMAVAGSQFLLSLQLLHAVDAEEFGRFSFLLIASQLSFGISSALLCAPYPIQLARKDLPDSDIRRQFFSANLVLSLIAAIAFFALAVAIGLRTDIAAIFGAYGGVMLLRWFARAAAYADGQPLRTTGSDIVYGITLLSAVAAMLAMAAPSLLVGYAALLVSAVLALFSFGWRFVKDQFLRVSLAGLASYRSVWKIHAKWSLLGVITTEATANAHAYIIVLIGGPAAFAPIAASALLIRPIALAMNALTDFERPQMARHLARGGAPAMGAPLLFFRSVLSAVWGGCAVLAVLVVLYWPEVVFPDRYEFTHLVMAAVIWFLIAYVRILRTPESVMLQAAGQFRPLAHASLVSFGVSIAAVLCILQVANPILSLCGILLGECVFAQQIWSRARRWLRGRNGQEARGI